MGDDFEKWLNISGNTASRILAGCVNSCQDEPMSTKIVIHKVSDKELLVPCILAIKNINRPFPQLKNLFLSPPRSDTDKASSHDFIPVKVSFPGTRIISRGIGFRSASPCQVVREFASRAIGTIATLKFPADLVALSTSFEFIRPGWVAGTALASESPISTASHNLEGVR